MIVAILLVLAQAAGQAKAPAAEASAPATPQRFSVLADPCTRASDDNGKDVVVCGKTVTASPRLPLPDERGPPDHPVASNPERTGAGALAAQSTPCAAIQRGCTVGFGAPIVEALAKGAVGLAKSAFARHPDKSNRVPIPLDDTPAN